SYSLYAKPQATFGIPIDKLKRLAEAMAVGQAVSDKPVTAATKRPTAEQEWGTQYLKDYAEIKHAHSTANEKVLNFVTYVQMFVKEAKESADEIPKAQLYVDAIRQQQEEIDQGRRDEQNLPTAMEKAKKRDHVAASEAEMKGLHEGAKEAAQKR